MIEKIVEGVKEQSAAIEQVPTADRTPFLDIAYGRLDAAIQNLQLHQQECAKRQADKIAVIETKARELETLQKEATKTE